MIVWLNGALMNADEARIDPADRGFTLGDGLFETIAVHSGKILRLDSHLARLKKGCGILDLPCPSTDAEMAIAATLAANELNDAVVRLTLTRGVAPRGLAPPETPQPTLLISAWPLPGAPPPAHCIVSTVTRRNEHSPLARIKSINYLDNILARREAVSRGANEAILLNTTGHVAETSSANLFIVRDGRVFTPPVADGALPGVMRAAVMASCNCIQKSLSLVDVFAAEGVFLSGSLGIRILASIDGKPTKGSARAFVEDLASRLAAPRDGPTSAA